MRIIREKGIITGYTNIVEMSYEKNKGIIYYFSEETDKPQGFEMFQSTKGLWIWFIASDLKQNIYLKSDWIDNIRYKVKGVEIILQNQNPTQLIADLGKMCDALKIHHFSEIPHTSLKSLEEDRKDYQESLLIEAEWEEAKKKLETEIQQRKTYKYKKEKREGRFSGKKEFTLATLSLALEKIPPDRFLVLMKNDRYLIPKDIVEKIFGFRSISLANDEHLCYDQKNQGVCGVNITEEQDKKKVYTSTIPKSIQMYKFFSLKRQKKELFLAIDCEGKFFCIAIPVVILDEWKVNK
jgi:hypothetical protein